MIEHLFVYGTLAPDGPNEHVLGKVEGSWEVASVTGFLRQKGWGAAMGYPGIDLDEHGDEIQSLVFSSERLSRHWAMLDEFEGKSYKRVLTTAKLQGDRTVDAYIYVLA